jgi:hypothetical protein
MTAAEILQAAQADGLVLALDADGRLTVTGSKQARDWWRFEFITQKNEIIHHLSAANDPEPAVDPA